MFILKARRQVVEIPSIKPIYEEYRNMLVNIHAVKTNKFLIFQLE
jgi:hypothetical protein